MLQDSFVALGQAVRSHLLPAAQLAVVEPHDEEVPALVFISPHLGLLHLQVACNIQGMCKPDLEGTMIAPLSIIVCKREKQHRSAACSQRLHQLELQHQPHTSRAGYADFKCLLCTSCTQQNLSTLQVMSCHDMAEHR